MYTLSTGWISGLVRLCSTILQGVVMQANEISQDILLSDLAELEGMSRRAFNACFSNRMRSLRVILQYYQGHGTFAGLRNVGRLTNDELIRLCLKYGARKVDLIDKRKESDAGILSLHTFAPERMLLLERYFRARRDSFTGGTRKLMKAGGQGVDRDVRAFVTFFSYARNRRTGSGTGKVKLRRIVELCDELREFARLLDADAGPEQKFEWFAKLWNRHFQMPAELLHGYREPFIQRHFPLFRFLRDILDGWSNLDHRERLLLRDRAGYFLDGERRSLEGIAADLGITRERVRQLGQSISHKVLELVTLAGPIHEVLDYEMMDGRNRDVIIITSETARNMNALEGAAFTVKFYATVCEVLHGGDFHVLEHYSDDNAWFLVRAELQGVFDFDIYLAELRGQRPRATVQGHVFDAAEYVRGCWHDADQLLMSRVITVCLTLGRVKMNALSDDNGKLIFTRNELPSLRARVIEMLKEADHPIHVGEIFDRVNAKYPGAARSVHSIRSVVANRKVFARYSAWSVYGLREWEGQREGLKSGGYSDIAEGFLRESDIPLYVSEVVNHVLRYRNAKPRHVLATLNADKKGRFRHFPNGRIGLVARDYPPISSLPVGLPPPYEYTGTYSGTTARRRESPALSATIIMQFIQEGGAGVEFSHLVYHFVEHLRIPERDVRRVLVDTLRRGMLVLASGDIVTLPQLTVPAPPVPEPAGGQGIEEIIAEFES